MNKVILEGLKKRLEDTKGNRVKELPFVLWAFRTTLQSSTRDTSFSLAFRTEVVIPLKVGLPALKTTQVDVGNNNAAMEEALYFTDERR